MIWIIAGTESARKVIEKLTVNKVPVIATTTTEYGKKLLGTNEFLQVVARALNLNDMITFIEEHGIKTIIDASHPFAAEVSNNAIAASKKLDIPYTRFERESVDLSRARHFNSYDEAALYLKSQSGNVLLTIGSKNISCFSGITRNKVYARVLPFAQSIEECHNAGFNPDEIIAMKFPFSKEFSAALYRELDIKFLVTKESGREGGLPEKIEAAHELGIEVLVIDRPRIDYPNICFDLDEIIDLFGVR
ncbi:MAG: cobalt-precorrin-6A reductase [bacterium]|nr:cobalt-precorrin-6A reductase [bacterium]